MSSPSSRGDDDQLAEWRRRIDAIDVELVRLFNERASCAQQIAKIKQLLNEQPEFYRPEREAKIIDSLLKRNVGPLSPTDIAFLFRELMSACRALEHELCIAYLGPEGTFTQEACFKHFGHKIRALPLPSIDSIFREVAAKNADFGVVPVENTSEGVVNHTLDSLIQSSLNICGEVELRIHHHLLSLENELAKIKKIYSHQQSFAQCRLWLNKHMVNIELCSVSSNGEAAKIAAQEHQVAAIAPASAAQIYGITALAQNIEDHPDNTTRFLVIGDRSLPPSGVQDKTTLLVSTRNRPGALYDLLKPLAENKISMTRIESRPSQRGVWDYVFFIDIEGHQDDPVVTKALALLRQEAALFKILGSYPRTAV